LIIILLSVSVFVNAQSTLRGAASGKHLAMGSAANAGIITSGDVMYKTTLDAQYNLITPENGCKWGATEPQRGQFNYGQCDTVHWFAMSSNQSFRGHNLCWGEGNPAWLTNGNYSPIEKRVILTNHIQNVMKHYGDAVLCWDVVNEAVADSGSEVFKTNVWYPAVPDYVDLAFKTARATNPRVKLFYNDYNIASATGWSAAKSQKVYDLVKSMKTRGIPIDGVGLQLHVDLSYGADMLAGIKQNMQRYADLDLEIHMTEIDVSCAASGQTCTWTPEKAAQQAVIYQGLLQQCIDQPKCTNFETWGFTDKYTWKTTANHPLPFDENYKPKPAFDSLLQTLLKAN